MNDQTSDVRASNARATRWRKSGILALTAILLVFLALALKSRPDLPLRELLPKYATGASRFAAIEGMKVHYRDEGVGPPLLLLHGTSSSLHTWDGWVERMKSNRRIIRLDLPGYGLTGPAPDGNYSAARDARVVLSLLDRLGIGRLDVAGNSHGGRVALTLALDHADRVRSLTLIDTRGLSGVNPTMLERLAAIPVLGQALRWFTPRALVRRGIEGVYGDKSRVSDSLVDRYDDLTRRDGNRQALLDRMAGPDDPDLDRRLSEIKVPVLLQWGARDLRIPIQVGYRIRDGVRAATLVIYEDAGHVPMEELPEITSADAACFLNGGVIVEKQSNPTAPSSKPMSGGTLRISRSERGYCNLPNSAVLREGNRHPPQPRKADPRGNS